MTSRTTRLLLLSAALLAPASAAARPWTDDPLQPGVTPIRSVHVAEMRSAIDGKRSTCGLPRQAWTTSAAAGTPIRAAVFNELRSAVRSLYSDLGMPRPSFTRPDPLTAGTPLRGAYVSELRTKISAAVSAACPVCTPSCSARLACGFTAPDGCGGTCAGGYCARGTCSGGSCVCTPSCSATLACGSTAPDGCGGTCAGGYCAQGTCSGGSCVAACKSDDVCHRTCTYNGNRCGGNARAACGFDPNDCNQCCSGTHIVRDAQDLWGCTVLITERWCN